MNPDRRPPCRKCGSQDQMWISDLLLVDSHPGNRWICRRCGYGGWYPETAGDGDADYDELAERHIEYHAGRS